MAVELFDNSCAYPAYVNPLATLTETPKFTVLDVSKDIPVAVYRLPFHIEKLDKFAYVNDGAALICTGNGINETFEVVLLDKPPPPNL